MGGSLDGPRLKLERARIHLKELHSALDDFREVQAKRVRIKRDSKTRRIEWFIENPDEPPETLGPIIGDCLYNTRSALDHLATQLVLANEKQPTNDTAYVIVGNAHQFACDSPKKLRGVAAGIVTTIERAQPYHRNPMGDYLGLLNKLANVDKHRHFHLVVNSVETATLNGWPEDSEFYYGPLGPGRTVLLSGRIPKPEMSMQYEPGFDVTFAEGKTAGRAEGWGVYFILRTCFDFTLSMVRELAQAAGLSGSIDHLIWPPDGKPPSMAKP